MAVRSVWLALSIATVGMIAGACGGAGKRGGASEAKPVRGIRAAALPYSVLDGRTGRQVDRAAFWSAVASSRVVCVGEEHPNPHHHWFQLETVTQVAAQRSTGSKLALGMEMFQRPYQGVLDDYAASRIDEAALLSRSGYAERWGYDYGFYGPTIDTARAAGAALLALNTPRELTKAVVRRGIEALTPDEKKHMPAQLVLDDAQHKAWFQATMEELGGHGHGSATPHKKGEGDGDKKDEKPEGKGEEKKDEAEGDAKPKMPSMDRIYTAQVLWDESMAEGAAAWATANATGLVVLLAGNGHCHDSAIVNRVKRRGVDRVISVRPVIDTEGRVAEALAKPINDYIVVLELPKK